MPHSFLFTTHDMKDVEKACLIFSGGVIGIGFLIIRKGKDRVELI